MTPPTPTNKRQVASTDPSPGRRNTVKKLRDGKGDDKVPAILAEAQNVVEIRGTSITAKDISKIQKEKAQIQTQDFQQKWIFGRDTSPSLEEFKKTLEKARSMSAKTAIDGVVKNFIEDRYSDDSSNAEQKIQDFFDACKDVKAKVTTRRSDGEIVSMNLLDVVRPVMDSDLKSALRREISNRTYVAVKKAYSLYVTKPRQAEFDSEFGILMKTNGGNDKITAQVMHEFAMQTKLKDESDDKTNGKDTTMTGTNGAEGASGSK